MSRVAVAVVLLVIQQACSPGERAADEPSEAATFVGRASCSGCHADAAETWAREGVIKAMDAYNPDTDNSKDPGGSN